MDTLKSLVLASLILVAGCAALIISSYFVHLLDDDVGEGIGFSVFLIGVGALAVKSNAVPRKTLANVLCGVSFCSLGWFLYWVCYDLFVWSKPLVEVNPVNYAGTALSIACITGGFVLRTRQE